MVLALIQPLAVFPQRTTRPQRQGLDQLAPAMAGNIPNPTPSSEIIHLVSTFADTIDALPPSLTRSLSDLKELDAVLSGEWEWSTRAWVPADERRRVE